MEDLICFLRFALALPIFLSAVGFYIICVVLYFLVCILLGVAGYISFAFQDIPFKDLEF